MYSIIVNYDPTIQDKWICLNTSFLLSCTYKQIRDYWLAFVNMVMKL